MPSFSALLPSVIQASLPLDTCLVNSGVRRQSVAVLCRKYKICAGSIKFVSSSLFALNKKCFQSSQFQNHFYHIVFSVFSLQTSVQHACKWVRNTSNGTFRNRAQKDATVDPGKGWSSITTLLTLSHVHIHKHI